MPDDVTSPGQRPIYDASDGTADGDNGIAVGGKLFDDVSGHRSRPAIPAAPGTSAKPPVHDDPRTRKTAILPGVGPPVAERRMIPRAAVLTVLILVAAITAVIALWLRGRV